MAQGNSKATPPPAASASRRAAPPAIAVPAVHTEPSAASEPGQRFNYSDGDASIAGAAIAAIAKQDLYRFAIGALFDPLRMVNHDWPGADAAGRPPGGWGLRLRPMDMAKLGQLYLQRGEWNGALLFGADFVDLAWAPGATASYGLYWWIGRAAQAPDTPYFYALGYKGQWIFVFPTLNMEAALSASLPDAELRAVGAVG